MIYYIGLIGSGKTTLYMKLNEEHILNAVEMELPQSCRNNEALKEGLLKLYNNSKDIDAIIAHPYYLPKNFTPTVNDTIIYLNVPFKERIRRVRNRSKNINCNCVIFPDNYLTQEEIYFKEFKERYK